MKTTKILVAGDYFVDYLTNLENVEAKDIFGEIVNLIKESDFSILNYEAPICINNISINKTGPVLKSNNDSLRIVKEAGFNLLTLSTNHIMDLGEDGYWKTINEIKNKSLYYVGAGKDIIEARKPFRIYINKLRISIINITENEFSVAEHNRPGANPLDIIDIYTVIKKEKEHCDYLLIIYHGGNEGYKYPTPFNKKLFRYFVDIGANAVFSHHTHSYSGYEIYNSCPIVYGLGNLIFDWKGPKNNNWYNGYLATIIIDDNKLKFEIKPYVQHIDRLGIRALTKEEENNFYKDLSYINTIIEDDEKLNDKYYKYAEESKKLYLTYLEPIKIAIYNYLKNKNILPSLLTNNYKKLLLNLIRCESHREILINILKNEISNRK